MTRFKVVVKYKELKLKTFYVGAESDVLASDWVVQELVKGKEVVEINVVEVKSRNRKKKE